VHDKEENNFLLIDIVIPDDSNVNTKEVEKLGKYKVLESEVSRVWKRGQKLCHNWSVINN